MNRLRVVQIVPTNGGRWSNLMQERDVTRGKRGHCTRIIRAKNAATTLLPVPLSETACNACIWPHLYGMKLLASTLSYVRSFRIT